MLVLNKDLDPNTRSCPQTLTGHTPTPTSYYYREIDLRSHPPIRISSTFLLLPFPASDLIPPRPQI